MTFLSRKILAEIGALSKVHVYYNQQLKKVLEAWEKVPPPTQGMASTALTDEEDSVVFSVVQRLEEHCYQRKTRLVDAFRRFDLNNDGTISSKEMYHCLEQLGMNDMTTTAERRILIQKLDTNGDGKIDIEEYLDLVRVTRRKRVAQREAGGATLSPTAAGVQLAESSDAKCRLRKLMGITGLSNTPHQTLAPWMDAAVDGATGAIGGQRSPSPINLRLQSTSQRRGSFFAQGTHGERLKGLREEGKDEGYLATKKAHWMSEKEKKQMAKYKQAKMYSRHLQKLADAKDQRVCGIKQKFAQVVRGWKVGGMIEQKLSVGSAMSSTNESVESSVAGAGERADSRSLPLRTPHTGRQITVQGGISFVRRRVEVAAAVVHEAKDHEDTASEVWAMENPSCKPSEEFDFFRSLSPFRQAFFRGSQLRGSHSHPVMMREEIKLAEMVAREEVEEEAAEEEIAVGREGGYEKAEKVETSSSIPLIIDTSGAGGTGANPSSSGGMLGDGILFSKVYEPVCACADDEIRHAEKLPRYKQDATVYLTY
jgi:hypothetical protein